MKKALMLAASLMLLGYTAEAQGKGKKQKISKMDKEFLKEQPDGMYAKIETNKGDIYTMLEFKKTPMTVANFVGLAEGSIKNSVKPEGTPYYDGLRFHRVIPDFMIQGGCPQGNGMGDPGYSFPDEIDTSLKHNGPGIMSMANRGKGTSTNGSQFFITHKETPWLDGSHSVFGHVVRGQDVVNKIQQNDTIRHVVILRKGKEAEKFNASQTFSTALADVQKKNEERIATQKAETDAILNKFKDAKKTPSGLQYVIEREGSGTAPTATSKVTVHYRGMLENGKTFDSSYDRGQTITFPLNQVIAGWTEGLQLIKPGGKIFLLIPPQLGYGERGAGDLIPPNSNLIFQVELFNVEN